SNSPPVGGSITVSAASPPSGGLCLIVKDPGVAIPEEKQSHVLEPSTQGGGEYNRRHTGTGLGLSLSKAFAELHGGSLELVSAVGIGTTVTVRFPASRLRRHAPEDLRLTTGATPTR